MSAEGPNTAESISLQGQVALVTGGGRGIGRAIALRLASAGASVAVMARSKNEIDETVRLIEEQSQSRALAVAADVTDAADVAEAMKTIERELGPVDILINNAAGLKPFGPFWETSVDEWWRTMEVNLRGVALCTHAVLPGMVARGRGRIVNVSSGAGAVSTPYYTAYTVSKAALIRFTECLALETGPKGVRVFSISPGTVRTSMTEYPLGSEEGKKWLPWFKRIFDNIRSVQTSDSTHAHRLRMSPACLVVFDTVAGLAFVILSIPASTSLRPFAPCPLRHFSATVDALTPGPVSCPVQVSLIHMPDLPTILSPLTWMAPAPLSHATPQLAGLPLQVWTSPLASRLAAHPGRIEFVILQTGSSPPVALHLASQRRNYSRLQAGERLPEEDFHLSNQSCFQAH